MIIHYLLYKNQRVYHLIYHIFFINIESIYNSNEEYMLDSVLASKQKDILDRLNIKSSYFDDFNRELSMLVIQN